MKPLCDGDAETVIFSKTGLEHTLTPSFSRVRGKVLYELGRERAKGHEITWESAENLLVIRRFRRVVRQSSRSARRQQNSGCDL
jgi:hypothetical protein